MPRLGRSGSILLDMALKTCHLTARSGVIRGLYHSILSARCHTTSVLQSGERHLGIDTAVSTSDSPACLVPAFRGLTR
jgi:hypothetical protein